MLGRIVVAAAWAFTLVGAAGGIWLLLMSVGTPYPEKRNSYAVIAIAFAVVPYVLAKACQALHRVGRQED